MGKRQERAASDAEDAADTDDYGRKLQCVPRVGRSTDGALTDESIERFQARGFVVVPEFLTSEELTFLRTESDQLFTALDTEPARATEKIVEQGCVLDTMAECPMAEDATARVNQEAYIIARVQQVHHLICPHITTINDASVLARLLFDRLSRHAQRLLDSPKVFFFNEHYVVKPPQSHVEFRWHRDDDEQLGMCIHREAIAPYVSAWCALDDATLDNGPLRFVPLDADPSTTGAQKQDADVDLARLEQLAGEPLVVAAGTVVLFLSNVWHCSSSNDSSSTRRAFYAQFSREPITATLHDDAPLSFAIPCGELKPRVNK